MTTYIRENAIFDITVSQVIGDNQYPRGYFYGEQARQLYGVFEVFPGEKPEAAPNQKHVLTGYAEVLGVWREVWALFPKTADDVAADAVVLAQAKVEKNTQINLWRAAANQTTFPHNGKLIACDQLSRSDIDAVANHVSLFGTFPAGFPGAWKATDNSYVMLPNTDAFKAMYTSMTTQGTTNFNHSQDLKGGLAAATTLAQVQAISW